MTELSRRAMLATAGVATVASVAGCSALGNSSPTDLNIWVRNDLDEKRAYEITVDSVTKTGTLASGETDSYVDVVPHPGVGTDVTVDVTFGIGSEDDFLTTQEGGDTLTVADETVAVFARNTEMGAFYGLSEDPGTPEGAEADAE